MYSRQSYIINNLYLLEYIRLFKSYKRLIKYKLTYDRRTNLPSCPQTAGCVCPAGSNL